MKAKENELISKISVLQLKPGDILVLKAQRKLSLDTWEAIKNNINTILKKYEIDIPVIGLDDGMDIKRITTTVEAQI